MNEETKENIFIVSIILLLIFLIGFNVWQHEPEEPNTVTKASDLYSCYYQGDDGVLHKASSCVDNYSPGIIGTIRWEMLKDYLGVVEWEETDYNCVKRNYEKERDYKNTNIIYRLDDCEITKLKYKIE